jgi:hypothetical protein
LASSFSVALFLVVPEDLKLVRLLHAEALTVMVALTADFVFNRWDLEILPCYRIRHIPWCVRYHAQSLRPEAFEYFYVLHGCGGTNLCVQGPLRLIFLNFALQCHLLASCDVRVLEVSAVAVCNFKAQPLLRHVL